MADAATGKVLAESSFLPPVSFNSLVTPTYGGRWVYRVRLVGIDLLPSADAGLLEAADRNDNGRIAFPLAFTVRIVRMITSRLRRPPPHPDGMRALPLMSSALACQDPADPGIRTHQ